MSVQPWSGKVTIIRQPEHWVIELHNRVGTQLASWTSTDLEATIGVGKAIIDAVWDYRDKIGSN
jgi:hypothetical protein